MPKILAPLLAAALLAGCTSMLPRGSVDTPTPFKSYADADSAARRIVPFQTPVSALRELGFDPTDGRNVTVIPYPDLLARLAPYSGVPMDALDPGIRQCILAKADCVGWQFHFERLVRRREGGFWSDFFALRRVTHVTGWSFDALVVAADGKVLFRNMAGQPAIDRVERQVNPLGPLQSMGESAGSALSK